MLDRVREAMFSILHDRVDDASVLDLFAGSGSLGLEALSRGAKDALFIEQDRKALAVLKKNIVDLGLTDYARAVGSDALSPLSWGTSADLIFMDPPYPFLRGGSTRSKVFDAMKTIGQTILSPDGIAIFHAPRREVREAEFGSDLVATPRDYGSSTIWLLERVSKA